MARPRARPRFTFELPLPPDEVTRRVETHLAARENATVEGSVHRRTVLLTVRAQARHFWSPHLDVQLSEAGTGTRVDGTFAPHPQIWTAFVAVQFLFGLLSIGAGVFLVSRLTLGGELFEPLLLLGLMLFGGGFSFGAAWVGQGLGSEQMYELRAFLDAALRDP